MNWEIKKYAWLGFDPKDTQDQYCIIYNLYEDRSGDDFILWFDTKEQRDSQAKTDKECGVIFLGESNA